MPDNVIILGAGASFNAGIPLLDNFLDQMLEFAYKGKKGNEPLSPTDKEIFEKVLKVREQLDGYHGRANFDDRNLEDILSILSFNVIGGNEADKENLKWLNRAIARTIELTCTVKHDGRLNAVQKSGSPMYREFWQELFKKFSNPTTFPTIITFNYDLVLERALFQLLVNTHYDGYKNLFPFDGIKLNYYYKWLDVLAYKVKYTSYQKADFEQVRGTTLEPCKPDELKEGPTIELLKLHGSLNFPTQKPEEQTEKKPTNVVDDPYILPPIFNKLNFEAAQEMWKIALLRLRSAKNVMIVGYSLAKTDIYMQYFLKTAVGPNSSLNRIFVFNPALSYGHDTGMQERYESCFSEGIRRRIIFQPWLPPMIVTTGLSEQYEGTFKHFVDIIPKEEHRIFF